MNAPRAFTTSSKSIQVISSDTSKLPRHSTSTVSLWTVSSINSLNLNLISNKYTCSTRCSAPYFPDHGTVKRREGWSETGRTTFIWHKKFYLQQFHVRNESKRFYCQIMRDNKTEVVKKSIARAAYSGSSFCVAGMFLLLLQPSPSKGIKFGAIKMLYIKHH